MTVKPGMALDVTVSMAWGADGFSWDAAAFPVLGDGRTGDMVAVGRGGTQAEALQDLAKKIGKPVIQCEMSESCEEWVTHLGSKGYVYCTRHAQERRESGWERARVLRGWEMRWIRQGRTLPSYKPGPEPKEV